MSKYSCYIYPEPQDKNRPEFIDLLTKEAGWDKDKVIDFLSKNDTLAFNNIEKECVLSLIQQFEMIGITGSIGPLEKHYQKKFKKFKNGFVPTWSWAAPIFNWLWLLLKGLGGKFAIYTILAWILSKITPQILQIFLGLAVFTYFGVFGTWDYYLEKVKGEPLWPKFPYAKFKLPLWIIFWILLAYTVIYPLIYAGTHLANMKAHKISSYTYEDLTFTTVPQEWTVFENPPSALNISIGRTTSEHTNETLSFGGLPDTKLIATIEKQNVDSSQGSEGKGIVAVTVKKPGLFEKFDTVRSPVMERMTSSFVGGGAPPWFMKWTERWFPRITPDVSYEEIAGREWGKATNASQIKMIGMASTFHMSVYWTVVNGKAVLVFSEAFSPYKDKIDSEVKTFLESLKVS